MSNKGTIRGMANDIVSMEPSWDVCATEVYRRIKASSLANSPVSCFIENLSEEELRVYNQLDIAGANLLFFPRDITFSDVSFQYYPERSPYFVIVGAGTSRCVCQQTPLIDDTFLPTSLLTDAPQAMFGSTRVIAENYPNMIIRHVSDVPANNSQTWNTARHRVLVHENKHADHTTVREDSSNNSETNDGIQQSPLTTEANAMLDFDNSCFFDEQCNKECRQRHIDNDAIDICMESALPSDNATECLHIGPSGFAAGFEETTSRVQPVLSPSNLTYQTAFIGDGWPTVALDWAQRERIWPGKDVIQDIINNGFHIIARSTPGGLEEDRGFCLLFASAEHKLALEMTETQRKCYAALKMIHVDALNDGNLLQAHHIKTALFWVSEQKESNFWTEDNMESAINVCSEYLMTSLKRGFLPHYFIPEFNLVGHFDDGNLQTPFSKVENANEYVTTGKKCDLRTKSMANLTLPIGSDSAGSLEELNIPNIKPQTRERQKHLFHVNSEPRPSVGHASENACTSTRKLTSDHARGCSCRQASHKEGVCATEAFWIESVSMKKGSDRRTFVDIYNMVCYFFT